MYYDFDMMEASFDFYAEFDGAAETWPTPPTETRADALSDDLDHIASTFEDAVKDLESEDKLGNFEIQRLMQTFNQAETLASDVQKKSDDTANAVIAKV